MPAMQETTIMKMKIWVKENWRAILMFAPLAFVVFVLPWLLRV